MCTFVCILRGPNGTILWPHAFCFVHVYVNLVFGFVCLCYLQKGRIIDHSVVFRKFANQLYPTPQSYRVHEELNLIKIGNLQVLGYCRSILGPLPSRILQWLKSARWCALFSLLKIESVHMITALILIGILKSLDLFYSHHLFIHVRTIFFFTNNFAFIFCFPRWKAPLSFFWGGGVDINCTVFPQI